MTLTTLTVAAALLLCAPAPQESSAAHREALVEELRELGPDASEERVELGREAIEAYAAVSDDVTVLELRQIVGHTLIELGRFEEAVDEFSRGVELAARSQRPEDRAVFLGNLALAATELGDYPTALTAVDQALGLARAAGDLPTQWRLLNLRGAAFQRSGEPKSALAAYLEAIEVLEELGERGKVGVLLNNVGVTLMNLERFDEALEYFERVEEFAIEAGDPLYRATALGNQGDVHHLQGHDEDALELHVEALSIREEAGDERGQGHSHHSLGAVHRGLGDPAASLEHLNAALAIQERLGLASDRVSTLASLAETYASLGDGQAAVDSANRSLDALETTRTLGRQAYVFGALARAHQAYGDFEAALEYEQQAGAARSDLLAHDTSAEFETLHAKLVQLEQEKIQRQQELTRYVLTSIAAGTSAFAVLGWLLFSLKRRAHRAQLQANEEVHEANDQLAARARELEAAATKIERLKELLSLCSNCKNVRYESGIWHPVEQYLLDHASAVVTHGICPDCVGVLYPNYQRTKEE